MKSKIIAFLAIFAAAICAVAAQEKIRIAGSDLLRDVLQEGLAHFTKTQNVETAMELDGSIPALKDLQSGKADVAIIAEAPYSNALLGNVQTQPLCAEVIYVAVNASNPLSEISIQQLASIYGQKSESTMDRWSGLGLTGVWGMRPILAFAPTMQEGMSVEIFKNIALDNAPLKGTVRLLDSAAAVISTLSTQEGALGFFHSLPEGAPATIKILSISTGRGQHGSLAFAPTMENAYLGDYPLNLPFKIAFLKGKEAVAAQLVHYLYSDEFSEFLKTKGFLPLPSGIRRNFTLGVDKIR